IRKGVTIGISSRGVGSLSTEHGKNVVQDDFELICWDVVTSPSTPGSWISSEQDDLTPYMESINSKLDMISSHKSNPLISEDHKVLLGKLNKFLS
ncbi:MAG: hypothetical protein GTO02_21815, partial [Candidatus Dadabacteria bacterium]|nr:hypothetical protein [Candidatus Dadabacteria bacterium]